MKRYYYCQVQPKGMKTVYSYIADEEIGVGAFVQVPFGINDHIVKGIVRSVGYCTEENAPFPVARTKRVIRVISREEYDRLGDVEPRFGSFDWCEDLEEIHAYIEDEDYDAMFAWACRHHDCEDAPEILQKVIECYELCAEQNNPAAALNLGSLYYHGHGVEQDYRRAVKFYEIAAAAGEVCAICNLGYCWYYGRHAEVDYEKAYHYFSLGALLYNDPNCMFKLGDMFYRGLYTEENRGYSFRLYQRARQAISSDEDKEDLLPAVQYRLGRAYLMGHGVRADLPLAYDYLTCSLSGLYRLRDGDPVVEDMIRSARGMIAAAEEKMDEESKKASERKQDLPRSVRGRIQIVSDRIEKAGTAAVVNAANEDLMPDGDVCGAIFRAAGAEELQAACCAIGRCDTGNAVVTPAFRLPAAEIIVHVVGPRWRDKEAPELLYGAYVRALQLAKEAGCRSIAFPLLSSGWLGCPLDKAWQLGLQACRDYLSLHPDTELVIRFAVPDPEKRAVGERILAKS